LLFEVDCEGINLTTNADFVATILLVIILDLRVCNNKDMLLSEEYI